MTSYKTFRYIRSRMAELGFDFLVAQLEMGAYCAKSIKRTHVYSSSAWIAALDRQTPAHVRRTLKGKLDVATVHVDPSTGKRGVTGGSDLKKTQAYTREFGWSVAEAYLEAPQIVVDLPSSLAFHYCQRMFGTTLHSKTFCRTCRGAAVRSGARTLIRARRDTE